MAKTINAGIGSALLKFTFTDNDGDVIAHFRLNPTDVKLATRCEEVTAFFSETENNLPEKATLQDIAKYCDVVEGKICYLLGYDARADLFGTISATTIMEDGDMFALVVLTKIIEAVEPEIRKRKNNMQAAMARHTAKYSQ